MIERIFSLLDVEIRITTDCDELSGGLDQIIPRARSVRAVSETLTFHIFRNGEGRYIIQEDDEAVLKCVGPEWTLVHLHHRVMSRACRGIDGALMIHGGCGTYHGKRFILCGEKGTGKTTLLCRLLFEGVIGHSDDIVFLDDGGTEPFPGKFHVKEGTLTLVPQLRPACSRLTSYPGYSGERFYFFDPADAGFSRTVDQGAVAFFFNLESGRSEKTEIDRCPKYVMVQKVMDLTLNLEKDPRHQIRTLCKAVNDGDCYTLRVKTIEQAVDAVKNVLS